MTTWRRFAPPAAGACALWLWGCSVIGACSARLQRPAAVLAASGATLAVLALTGLTAWAVRSAWILGSTSRRLGGMSTGTPPERLAAAGRDAGIERLDYIPAEAAVALCAGALRPRVLVSGGLLGRLRDDELAAVLTHEQDHVRRREPLRRAMRQAAADVGCLVPVVGWWARRCVERAELDADRAALDRIGPRSLAGALWAVAEPQAGGAQARFGGAAEARVAQVLGEPLPRWRVPRRLWAASAVGLLVVVGMAWCAVQLVTVLR